MELWAVHGGFKPWGTSLQVLLEYLKARVEDVRKVVEVWLCSPDM